MKKDVVVKTFQALADGCSQKVLEEADNEYSKFRNETKDIVSQVRIPILTDDVNVKKYVKEFELEKLENLTRFFVEGYYASFENIASAVNALQMENLIMVLGKIRAAKDGITIGINDPADGREYLKQAHSNILEACGMLEGLLQNYIGQIKQIDQKHKWQFFLGAKGSLSKVDMNISCARKAIDALDVAIRLQALIAMQLNQKSSMVITGHVEALKNMLTADHCDLLCAYDKNKRDEYWGMISQKIQNLEVLGGVLEEYYEEAQQSRIGVGQAKRKGGFFKRWKKWIEKNNY